jgi:hypothetical protein
MSKARFVESSIVFAFAVGCSAPTSHSGIGVEESAVDRAIDPAKEMVITHPAVIEAIPQTKFDPRKPSGGDVSGAWSFGRLVHNMLPKESRNDRAKASALVMNWMKTWEAPQSPNPNVAPASARPHIRDVLIEPWKVASGCSADASTDDTCVLDMTVAPFRLMAIVYRPDLRVPMAAGTPSGGEGRFVFQLVGPTFGKLADGTLGIVDATPKPQKFTVIFEYSLPVKDDNGTIDWAKKWHALGDKDMGKPLCDALLPITVGFAGPDRDLRRPNGNAIDQVRTNEVATQGARFVDGVATGTPQYWELREFHLTTSGLVPYVMNQEPSRELDVPRAVGEYVTGGRTAELESILAANDAVAAAGKYDVPDSILANSSLVGSAPYGAWGKTTNSSAQSFAGVSDAARDGFALQTCAGCHRHETSTAHFMHVSDVRAIDDVDKAQAGVTSDTAPTAIVLSSFLRREISPPVAEDPGSGARYADFDELLHSTAVKPSKVKRTH